MIRKPKVSVVMITYLHEKYIIDAIEGVLNQICDFDFELIIANDNSPDKTDEVIKAILKTNPSSHKINYIKHDKNKGMMPNFIFALQQAKGTYTALCEGDDYWTDPNKLQKQVDFLEANPDYILCFHKVKILKSDGSFVDDFITNVPENYETQETLARLGNYIHTPSVVFRNVISSYPKEFVLSPIGDYFLYMLLAEHGKLKFLDEEMAVYRYGVGVFSSKSLLTIAKSTFQFFTLYLSYSNDSKINQFILKRQLGAFDGLEYLIRKEYSEAFVSNNVFFKALKSLKRPNQFWRKFKKKLMFITLSLI